MDAINALRGAAVVGALSLNAQLNAAAATHSRDMSVQNRPWHFGSDGSSPIDRLAREKRADRTALWSLISSGPASAMGLTDRGEIRTGKRADLVLVDWPKGHTPAIQGTWVAGRCAYRAQPNQ